MSRACLCATTLRLLNAALPQLIHHYCYKMVEIKRYNHFSKLNGSKA